MATWKRSNLDPITVEREVRVFDANNPSREGYVDVRYGRTGVKFSEIVREKTTSVDREGNILGESYTVIDANPTFA